MKQKNFGFVMKPPLNAFYLQIHETQKQNFWTKHLNK